MFKLGLTCLAVLVGASGTVLAQTTVIDFESAPVGAASVCTPGLTGGGEPVDWQIVEDSTAPNGSHAIAELSEDDTNNRFPLCVFSDPQAQNVEVSASFKPISGDVDQAAGLIIRVRDENNYYITRANALEDNVRFYKVENGRRRELEGKDIEIPNGQWQTLGLRMQGNRADVLLNGEVLFSSEDDTFKDAGRIGLWTKADSITHFDQLEIKMLP